MADTSCTHCGAASSGNFCIHCGKQQPLRCSKCQNRVLRDANFCGACGNPLGQKQKRPSSRSKRRTTNNLGKPTNHLSGTQEVVEESVMPACDIYIPDPDEGISQEDKDAYEEWVKEKLEPILDLYKISYLTSRHVDYPMHGVHFTLVDSAMRKCKFVLYLLSPALAGRTTDKVFKDSVNRTIYLRNIKGKTPGFQHIDGNRIVIPVTNDKELHSMAQRLHNQLKNVPARHNTEFPSSVAREAPVGNNAHDHQSLGRARSIHDVRHSSSSSDSQRLSRAISSVHISSSSSSDLDIENPSSDTAAEDKHGHGEEQDEDGDSDRESTASTCTGSEVSEKDRCISMNLGSDDIPDCSGAASAPPNQAQCHEHQFTKVARESGSYLQICNKLEQMSNTAESSETLLQMLKEIEGCQNRSEFDEKLSNNSGLFMSRHLIPFAQKKSALSALGLLFVFGDTVPLKMTAGHALRLVLTTLDITSSLDKLVLLESRLKCGLEHELSSLDPMLITLYVEIYKLVLILMVVAFKISSVRDRQQFHLSRDVLQSALRVFMNRICQYYPSMTEPITFHLGIAIDILGCNKLWKDVEGDPVADIIEAVVHYTKSRPSPQDQRHLEEQIVDKYTKARLCETEKAVLLPYFACVVKEDMRFLKCCKPVLQKEIKASRRTKSKFLLFTCALLAKMMCENLHHQEYESFLFDKVFNPFSEILTCCQRIANTSCHMLREILSPLLFHTNTTVRTRTLESVLVVNQEGKLSPESIASLIQYRLKHLQFVLSPYGITLGTDYNFYAGTVTFKGELHCEDTSPIICRASFPRSLQEIHTFGNTQVDKTLCRHIQILRQLSLRSNEHRHFTDIIIFDDTSKDKFYVIKQDWKALSLSQKLLGDLNANHQEITLDHKMKIIHQMIESAHYAHTRGILLRAFSADCFYLESGTQRMTFWDVDAMRLAVHDSQTTLHYTGEKQDCLPILWLAPESILESKFSEHSEVYSLAKGSYEVLCHGIYPHTGHTSMDTASIIRQNLQYMTLPERRVGIPMTLYLTCLSCLLITPGSRPSIQALLTTVHNFIKHDLHKEEQLFTLQTIQYFRLLAEIQKMRIVERKLPREFEYDLKPSALQQVLTRLALVTVNYVRSLCRAQWAGMVDVEACSYLTAPTCHHSPSTDLYTGYARSWQPEDLWSHGRGSDLEKRYTRSICEPWGISQCDTEELYAHDDPRPIMNNFGLFESCIIKDVSDTKEHNLLVNLSHKNLPKDIKYAQCHKRCRHTVLQMFVATNCQDILSYFLSKQPDIRARLGFYWQIRDAIEYIHGEGLVLCYLNPMHIYVIDGGSQCVISHLGRATRLVKQGTEQLQETMVRPFVREWPKNAARCSPLESNESGCFSMASDVAMLAFCILQNWKQQNLYLVETAQCEGMVEVEAARYEQTLPTPSPSIRPVKTAGTQRLEWTIGRSKDVPIKDTVLFPHVQASELIQAQRCKNNPAQSMHTPNWLYKLCLSMISNQPFRRPTIGEVKHCLEKREFQWPEKETAPNASNQKKRVSAWLDEEEGVNIKDNDGMCLSTRGTTEFTKRRRKSEPDTAVEIVDGTKPKSIIGSIVSAFRGPKKKKDSALASVSSPPPPYLLQRSHSVSDSPVYIESPTSDPYVALAVLGSSMESTTSSVFTDYTESPMEPERYQEAPYRNNCFGISEQSNGQVQNGEYLLGNNVDNPPLTPPIVKAGVVHSQGTHHHETPIAYKPSNFNDYTTEETSHQEETNMDNQEGSYQPEKPNIDNPQATLHPETPTLDNVATLRPKNPKVAFTRSPEQSNFYELQGASNAVKANDQSPVPPPVKPKLFKKPRAPLLTPKTKDRIRRDEVTMGQPMGGLAKTKSGYEVFNPQKQLRLREETNMAELRESGIYEDID